MNWIVIAALALAATGCSTTHSTLTSAERDLVPEPPASPGAPAAPDLVVERSRVIAAPAARVFAVLADVERWPEWDPGVTRTHAHAGRPLAAGDAFYQEPQGWKVEAVVLDAEPGAYLRWRGEGAGAVGVHSYRLVPLPGDRTLVVNREEFHGWYVPLLAWATDLGIGEGFDATLSALQARLEGAATAAR